MGTVGHSPVLSQLPSWMSVWPWTNQLNCLGFWVIPTKWNNVITALSAKFPCPSNSSGSMAAIHFAVINLVLERWNSVTWLEWRVSPLHPGSPLHRNYQNHRSCWMISGALWLRTRILFVGLWPHDLVTSQKVLPPITITLGVNSTNTDVGVAQTSSPQ